MAAPGAARGTDSVSAMLSPGEFVVNAEVPPTFRQEGGTVNNTTVGDINVTVKQPKATAREIANEMRKEMRRGTSRL